MSIDINFENIKLKPYVCYMLKNVTKNKVYIGITQNFDKRKIEHLSLSKQKNKFIKNDLMNGDEFIMNIIVDNIGSRSEAEDIEYYKIQEYNSIKNGYNIVCSSIPLEIIKKITIDLANNLELNYDQIADKYGVSPGTIANINKGYLVQFSQLIYPIRLSTHGKIKTMKILQEVMTYLHEDVYSIQELAKMYDCTPQQIQYINQNVGLKLYDNVVELAEIIGIKSFPINPKYVSCNGITNKHFKNKAPYDGNVILNPEYAGNSLER